MNKIQRIREVKRWGDSRIIKLEKADLMDFNLKEGDKVIIDDIIKLEDEKNDKRRKS